MLGAHLRKSKAWPAAGQGHWGTDSRSLDQGPQGLDGLDRTGRGRCPDDPELSGLRLGDGSTHKVRRRERAGTDCSPWVQADGWLLEAGILLGPRMEEAPTLGRAES